MDYKEKYKEALERARIFIKRWNGIEATDSELVLQELKEIFPELKESEDEKIRKEIIQSIQDDMCVIHKDKCIAWLEKQGEQKPADKVEPKFKAGDFIADGRRVFLVLANTEERNLGETYSTYCEGLVLNVYGDVLVDGKDFSDFRLATDIERANFVHDLKVGTKINYKPAEWSEEDDGWMKSTFDKLSLGEDMCLGERMWIQSLKQRMKGE